MSEKEGTKRRSRTRASGDGGSKGSRDGGSKRSRAATKSRSRARAASRSGDRAPARARSRDGGGPARDGGDPTTAALDRTTERLERQGGFLAGPTSLAAAIGRVLSQQVQQRIPKADLDERDPDYIRETLPRMWLVASFYFRADVKGLHKIPAEGPVLLVGNHSGGNLTPDTTVFTLAFNTYFGVERRFYQLAHNLVLAMPGLGFLRKYGTVAASHENANRALDSGAALLVYPGGDYEVHRPSWESAKVDFGGRKGFIRRALARDVPIVPVVSIGGQETALFLSRGEWLAKLLRLDRLFRLKVVPISIAPPWGLVISDMYGRIPLPAKISVRVLDPINVREEFGKDPDVDEVYDEIIGRMQRTLDALAAQRTLPLVG